MANLLLGVSGSVAACRTPTLAAVLGDWGHEVRVVATEPALYFFDAAELPPSVPLLRDADEWPRHTDRSVGYRRGEPILHIELRRWADLLLLAPLDANTLAKLAAGLADNLLMCVWRCWSPTRPVLLAPAMNTLMWESRVTARQLRTLWQDWRDELPATNDQLPATHDRGRQPPATAPRTPFDWAAAINRDCRRLRVVGPICKRLACGDDGAGAMAEVADIAAAVQAALAPSLGEPTPAPAEPQP